MADLGPDQRDVVEDMYGLSLEEQLFVKAYCLCFNATEAYLAVKPEVKRASAGMTGMIWLRKPEVRNAIDKIVEERKQSLELDARLLLHELLCVANSKITDLLNDQGEIDLSRLKDAPEHVKRAVEMVENTYSAKTGDSKVKVKMHDKLKAIELLGKHLKIWTEKLELTGKDGEKLSFIVSFEGPEPPEE